MNVEIGCCLEFILIQTLFELENVDDFLRGLNICLKKPDNI